MSAETRITSLLYRGRAGDGTVDAAPMPALWEGHGARLPERNATNQAPDHRHRRGRRHGELSQYYTVLQQTDDFPLQQIAAGRSHDRFECVNGAWRFCFRDYTLVDMSGDLRPISPVPSRRVPEGVASFVEAFVWLFRISCRLRHATAGCGPRRGDAGYGEEADRLLSRHKGCDNPFSSTPIGR
jgi:hypothetical protein